MTLIQLESCAAAIAEGRADVKTAEDWARAIAAANAILVAAGAR